MKSKFFKVPFVVTIILFGSGLLSTNPVFSHGGHGVTEIKPTAGETHHLEVKPESKEGYRLPYMEVAATILDQETQEVKTVQFHPMFSDNFHYGANVSLQPKTYLISVYLNPPTFVRGHTRASQWLTPVEEKFVFDASIPFEKSIKIGSKETADMKILFEAEHTESMFALTGAGGEHFQHGKSVKPPKWDNSIAHQIKELLPFKHVKEGHGLAFVLSIIFWASLILWIVYPLMTKINKSQ